MIDAEDVNCSINWKESEEKCATDLNKLKQIGDAMCDEMHAGLASKGGSKLKVGSKLKMFVSYVDKLLTRYVRHLKFVMFMLITSCFL